MNLTVMHAIVEMLVNKYKTELARFGTALPKKAREALIDGFSAGAIAALEEMNRRFPLTLEDMKQP